MKAVKTSYGNSVFVTVMDFVACVVDLVQAGGLDSGINLPLSCGFATWAPGLLFIALIEPVASYQCADFR